MSQEAIRRALRANTDGLTAIQIARQTPMQACNITKACAVMPDIYIKTWIKKTPTAKCSMAVYAAVTVPENAPRPI